MSDRHVAAGGTAADELATPKGPLRILHVTQPVEAGVANVVKGLVSHQVGRGAQVTVASPSGPFASHVTEIGAQHHEWQAQRDPGTSTLTEIRRLRQIVRAVEPDVVHLHSAKAGLAGRAALRGSVPTLYQPHAWSDLAASGAVARAARLWESFAQRWTDATIVSSEYELQHGRELGAKNSVLVPNGVDVVRFEPSAREAARHELGISEERTVVLCVGRLAEQKGQDLLLDAWRTLNEPGAELHIVGDGPKAEAVQALARETEGVVVHAQASDPRLWYAAADLVVLPSRWEGASLVLLEAMASGRSVVGFDVGGLATTLDNPSAAVRPLDVPGLKSAIQQRIRNSRLRGAEEVRNRARACDAFTADESYRKFTSTALRATRP